MNGATGKEKSEIQRDQRLRETTGGTEMEEAGITGKLPEDAERTAHSFLFRAPGVFENLPP